MTLFVVWDASRWITHWLMHRLPALWAFHQVHHSAEVLTPLTFHRLHPVESLVYQLRSALSTALVTALFFWLFRDNIGGLTLLGVPAAGLVLNAQFHEAPRASDVVRQYFAATHGADGRSPSCPKTWVGYTEKYPATVD